MRAEDNLQKAVVQHLRLVGRDGVFFFAIPNEGQRSPRTMNWLKSMGLRPGCPDLCVIINGKAHGLELKTEKGRQSENQRNVEAEWDASGGEYRVAKGINEAVTILREWGAIEGKQ